MKKLFILICLVVVSFSFSSCEKEYDVSNSDGLTNEKKTLVHLSDNDAILVDLAKSLAKSISNKQVFETLKQKIDEKIDGDYNTLFVDIMNVPIKTENGLRGSSIKTFLDFLAESHENSEGAQLRSGTNSFVDQINELVQKNPLLQIAMPLQDDYSQMTTEELQNSIVTFIPENYKEGSTQWIVGFDAVEEEYTLSVKTPPSSPVIVISQNERFIVTPSGATPFTNYSNLELSFSTNGHDYYLPTSIPVTRLPFADGGGGSGGGAGSGAGEPIYLFKIGQLQVTQQHDDWINGGSEFEFRNSMPLAPGYTTTGLTVQRFEISRSDISNKKTFYFNNSRPLNTNWRPEQIHNALKIIETDTGGTKNWEVKLGVSLGPIGNWNVDAKIPYGSNDDEIYQMVLDRSYVLSSLVTNGNNHVIQSYRGVNWTMPIITVY
jgi:hypothetical protein